VGRWRQRDRQEIEIGIDRKRERWKSRDRLKIAMDMKE
jgi:hypothetical protein